MKDFNIETYRKPTDIEKKSIGDKMCQKKDRYYSIALSFGTLLLGFTTIFMIFCALDGTLLFDTYPCAVCFIGYYVGICSFFAAYRCYWEKKLFRNGDFMVKDGYVKEYEKKHNWKTLITVCYSDKTTETFSIIKPDVKKNDKIYVALVNQNFAPWVLPRLITKK